MKRTLTTSVAIMVIMLAAFFPLKASMVAVNPLSFPPAQFTGATYDHGEDTDGDGLFNFLIVDVEVEANQSGTYEVGIDGLQDMFGSSVYYYPSNETFLDLGRHNVTVTFNGIPIYMSKLDVANLGKLHISQHESSYSYIYYGAHLSRTYTFTEFDTGAVLTGAVTDEGIDPDSDGLFKNLLIGIELNVSDEGDYTLRVNNLVNSSGPLYQVAYVSSNVYAHLLPGIEWLNTTFYGAPIFASHIMGLSMVETIDLHFQVNYQLFKLDFLSNEPLTRPYNYNEFQTPIRFTGSIADAGIDDDADSLFEYLEISVGVNVTEAGYYSFGIHYLQDGIGGSIYVYPSADRYFDVGVQFVNVTVYGPQIYVSHVDPLFVRTMDVRSMGWPADEALHVALPTSYSYTDFESLAMLASTVTDTGVDSDSDGLFDYLSVDLGVNVTQEGMYLIQVGSLAGTSTVPYTYQTLQENFTVGFHTVNLRFSGSTIAYNGINPSHVADVYLYGPDPNKQPGFLLEHIPSISLSKTYSYAEFDPPLNDIRLDLTVYPNGTLIPNGNLTCSHIYPPYAYPKVNTTVRFSTVDNMTSASANGTFALPPDTWSWFTGSPQRDILNSINASFASQYDNGTLDTSLDATFYPPYPLNSQWPLNTSNLQVNAAYSNGLLHSQLTGNTLIPSFELMPIVNVSDIVLHANYDGNKLTGNITLRAASGLPVGDFLVNFGGNRTFLDLTGNVNVTFGNYFGMDVNATYIDQLLTNLTSDCVGPTGLVSNMTSGLLECTEINTIETPWSAGVDITYEAAVRGNFTGFLARLLNDMLYGSYSGSYTETVYAELESALNSVQSASLELLYYHSSGIATVDLQFDDDTSVFWDNLMLMVPPTVPLEAFNSTLYSLKMYNLTASAIQNFTLSGAYSNVTGGFGLSLQISMNVAQLKKDAVANSLAFMPDYWPPETARALGIVESFFNTTYANLTHADATMTYQSGLGTFNLDALWQGDFQREFDYSKDLLMDFFNSTNPSDVSWTVRLLNSTQIDISNLSLDSAMGDDWVTVMVSGVKLVPQKNVIDTVRFTFSDWFNMTNDTAMPPHGNDKMRITVNGGFDGTNVVLLYAPGSVPTHETSLDYKTMTWQNTTLTSLKALVLQIAYQGVVGYAGTTFYVPVFTNSSVSLFTFNPADKSVGVSVTGEEGTGFCNFTIPRNLLYASPDQWIVKVDGVPVNYSATENAAYAFVYVNHSHSAHVVEVSGSWIVPEFHPPLLLVLFAAIAAVSAILVVNQRKRIAIAKTRFENSFNALMARISTRTA